MAFFTPYFFSRPSVDDPKLAGLFLDTRPSDPNRALQMETQYVPGGAFQLDGLAGEAHDRQLGISQPQIDDDPLRQQAELVRQAFRGQAGRRRKPQAAQ